MRPMVRQLCSLGNKNGESYRETGTGQKPYWLNEKIPKPMEEPLPHCGKKEK